MSPSTTTFYRGPPCAQQSTQREGTDLSRPKALEGVFSRPVLLQVEHPDPSRIIQVAGARRREQIKHRITVIHRRGKRIECPNSAQEYLHQQHRASLRASPVKSLGLALPCSYLKRSSTVIESSPIRDPSGHPCAHKGRPTSCSRSKIPLWAIPRKATQAGRNEGMRIYETLQLPTNRTGP
jgi:hypothetical protein